MITYAYNIGRIQIFPANVFFRILGGNSTRRTLIISNSSGNALSVSANSNPLLTGAFAYISANLTLVMPYRDFGPIIQSEIFVSTIAAPVTINWAEVFEVPNQQC